MSEPDLAVVGAGPAGLAAAVAAAECGLSVVLIDAAAQTGGQYWRHPAEYATAGTLADQSHGQHHWNRFLALRERLAIFTGEHPGPGSIVHLAGHQVWFVERTQGGRVALHLTPTTASVVRQAPVSIRAAAVILCPGGYDRQLPVPGWDLPGVMAAGGVQALLKAHRSLAGRRAVVAGTGPFLLPVASALATAGADVLAICEAGAPTTWVRTPLRAAAMPSKGLEALEYAMTLARKRIRYRTRTVVSVVSGADTVTGVSLRRLDRRGRLREDIPPIELDVDLVAFGWGFTPAVELLTSLGVTTRVDVDESLIAVVDRDQRTDVPGVYAAGEVTGVGGALLALAEGELAALTVSAEAGHAVPARRRKHLQRQIARARSFAEAMHRAHPVPAGWSGWLSPDTVVCRCEEVTVAAIDVARDELGACDARTVKLLARPGMGWCQGRLCGYAVATLARCEQGPLTTAELLPSAKRTLAAPVTLSQLAASGAEDHDQQ